MYKPLFNKNSQNHYFGLIVASIMNERFDVISEVNEYNLDKEIINSIHGRIIANSL